MKDYDSESDKMSSEYMTDHLTTQLLNPDDVQVCVICEQNMFRNVLFLSQSGLVVGRYN